MRFKQIKGIILDYYERKFLLVDFIFSVLIMLLVVYKLPLFEYLALDKMNDLNSLIASFFGTMLGFLITIVTVIYSFSTNKESKALERLNRTGIYPKLYSVYFNTMLVTSLLILLSFLYFITNIPEAYKVIFEKSLFFVELVFMLVFTFRISRCIWILHKLIGLAYQRD